MAKGRMLHRKISLCAQVNRLSLEAQILFTWAIPHADDDGRMSGDPDVISATVVPMKRWSDEKIRKLLDEIQTQKLINRWKIADSWYIEFPTWTDFQHIQKDRYTPSKIPASTQTANTLDTNRVHEVSKQDTQESVSERSTKEINKSEIKDKTAPIGASSIALNPRTFVPRNNSEYLAKAAWMELEPNNLSAFYTTYLPAVRKGLPDSEFGRFVSEIKQSKTDNPGAVFNTKVKEFLNRK